MKTQIEALKRERAGLIKNSQDIFARAEKEGRAPNTEELSEIGKLHEAAKTKKSEADQLERAYLDQQAAESDLNTSAGRRTGLRLDSKTNPNRTFLLKLGKDRNGKVKTARIMPGTDAHRRCQREYRRGFSGYLRGDGVPQAVTQTDIATQGGYLAPEQFNAELIRDLDEVLWIRQLSRTFMTDAPEFSTPYRKARVSSLARGTELATPTADTALKFGKRKIAPHYMTGQVDVSRDLRRSSVINIDEIVKDEIRFEVESFEEQEFMTGTGAALQALGIFTASAHGISTDRDVTAASATVLDADVLRTAKYKLKQQYRNSPSLSWVFHRDAVLQLSKLKDANGQYLWTAGIRFGDPDQVLGIPLRESEYAPNTFSASSYVGVIGDFRYYWIVDGMGLEIQVCIETGAAANKDQIIYRRKMDAAPVQELAFARIKLAAS